MLHDLPLAMAQEIACLGSDGESGSGKTVIQDPGFQDSGFQDPGFQDLGFPNFGFHDPGYQKEDCESTLDHSF